MSVLSILTPYAFEFFDMLVNVYQEICSPQKKMEASLSQSVTEFLCVFNTASIDLSASLRQPAFSTLTTVDHSIVVNSRSPE